jgi:hypothetical protein
MLASFNGKLEVVKYLVEAGADIHLSNQVKMPLLSEFLTTMEKQS